MMKFVKKTFALLLTMVMVTGVFSTISIDAKELTIAAPKITVKKFKKSTGVTITIGKTNDADGYEVVITGIPANREYCDCFKHMQSDGTVGMKTGFSIVIDKNGKSKRSLTYKNLQPGTYTVKVRFWNNKKYGIKTYSEWSKDKTFTLKESATNGYTTSYDFSKVKKGDVIKFGAYEQDLNYTNGKENIEWIVLKKTKNSMLILSKYVLDRLPYNKDYIHVTWENCTLRKWLNKDFINSAFNKIEQSMIKTTKIENFDNAVYKTAAGNDTKDKVFLLSQLEILNSAYGFSEDYNAYNVNRRCTFAWYKNIDSVHTGWWWLRSPGEYEGRVAYVDVEGSVDYYGGRDVNDVGVIGNVNFISVYDSGTAGVRPAMWIKLNS